MARHAQRRENLLRDARALTPRVLLQLTVLGKSVEVFAGFRGDSLSLYFGEDPVYHFNAAGETVGAVIERLRLRFESQGYVPAPE